MKGQALSRHNDIDAIAFTGSDLYRETAAERCRRQQHETRLAGSGRQSANIVFADCPDLQKRRARPQQASSANQGRCIAGTRLLLEESIADEFLDPLKQQAQTGSRAIHLIPQPPWAP
ncbi:aldehyde dehydrogenase family protein [Escherichia coli]|nr:aldehyde dehydrogenase family protein [Escherichia coli]